jgi:diacylglycerol kinase (CTP)
VRYAILDPLTVKTKIRPTATVSTMLRQRNELHLVRKLWHVGSGLGLYWLIFLSGLSRPGAALLLSLLLTASLTMELARLRLPGLNRIVLTLCGPIMRCHEARKLSGIPFYLAGTLIAILVFPDPVARLALLYLVLGDPAASMAGVLSNHRGPKLAGGKTLIGTAFCIAVCMAVTLIFFVLGEHSLAPATLLLLTLGGGIAGGTAELVPLPLDDNLTIPVLSGLLLWPLYTLLL